MRMQRPSLPDKVIAVDEALATARIPHAFGGALALAYYGEPRVTVDIDINLFVATSRWPAVRDALAPLGVDTDLDERRLDEREQVRLHWGRNPIDLFFAYDKLHTAMKGAARRVPFGEGEISILSPEHLMVCKVAFDRAKDWIDIEQMLAITDPLDFDDVTEWLERMLPEGDSRLQRLRTLARETRGV